MLDPAVVSAQVNKVKENLDDFRADFRLMHGPVDVLRHLVTHTWSAGELEAWLANAGNRNDFQRLLSTDAGAVAIGASATAMTAIASNATALQLATDSYFAMRAWFSATLSANILAASSIAMNTLLKKSDAVTLMMSSCSAINAFIDSQIALDCIFASNDAKVAFLASTAAPIASVPYMTSSTTPSGVARESSYYSSKAGWVSFSLTSEWFGAKWTAAQTQVSNQWISYEFPIPVFIHTAKVDNVSGASYNTRGVNSCRIECSDDGSSWLTVSSRALQMGGHTDVTFAKAGRRKHWRLYAVNNHGDANYLGLSTVNFVGFQ